MIFDYPILAALAFCGYSLYQTQNREEEKVAQIDYENQFLVQHREFLERLLRERRGREGQTDSTFEEPFIPLAFEHRHFENLMNLCTQSGKAKPSPETEEFQPRVEIQIFDFRKVVLTSHKAVRVELIRCTKTHGIINARNGRTGFILEIGPERTSDRNDEFYIQSKFHYEEKIPQADPRTSGQAVNETQAATSSGSGGRDTVTPQPDILRKNE